jgi:hypothetical protein
MFDPLESVTVFSSTWPLLGDNVEYDAAGIETVAGCDINRCLQVIKARPARNAVCRAIKEKPTDRLWWSRL